MLHARIFVDSVSFVDISSFHVEGMRVTLTPGWEYLPCDVAIMYGLLNPRRRSAQGRLRNAIHREHKGPVVVIESSLIGRLFKPREPGWLAALRGHPRRPQQIHPYYRVAVGGALGDDADFCASDSPPDRWERVQAEFGIKLRPYRTHGDHILLIGQIPKDASLRGVDMISWLCDTAEAIRVRSKRPIVIRPHPSMRWRDYEQLVRTCIDLPGVTLSPLGKPLPDDLAGAWTCVTLSSGAAVDALIAGIPPICLSPANLAYKICSRILDDIENPAQPEREPFLRDLCYSQWSLQELADGTAWKHILPAVERELARRTELSHQAEMTPAASGKQSQGLHPSFLQSFYNAVGHLPGGAWILRRCGNSLFRDKRYDQARTVFETLRARKPGMAAGHVGFARTAERQGHWELAAEAWSEAVRISPHRQKLQAGKARALLRLQRTDEAEGVFTRLRDTWPSDISGLRGLERVAEQRQDWPRILAIQEEIWSRFGDPDAMRRKSLLLVRLGRIGEARDLADKLKSQDEPLAHLLALLPVFEATHDWDAMDLAMRTYEPLLLANWHLVHSYVHVLGRLGRTDEAFAILDRSEVGVDSARRTLQISTLIRAQRYQEADRLLCRLANDNHIEDLPAELLSPFIVAAIETDGAVLGTTALERIEADAPLTPSGDVLRILTLFQRFRLQSLGLLGSATSLDAGSQLPLEQQLKHILYDRPVASDGKASRDAVLDLCDRFARLRSTRRDFFPDPSFILTDALEVAARILDAVHQGQPLSLIRLGDGEGSLLHYRDDFESFRSADKKATQHTWWGYELNETDLRNLERELAGAICAADIVGFPDLERTSRALLNGSVDAISDSGRNVRGLLASIDFITDSGRSANAMLTSCHIHQSLSFWGIWDFLLPQIGSLSLITCHSGLAGFLAKRHNVRISRSIIVPSERKYAAAFGTASAGRHYPDAFERIRKVVSGGARDQVFLVAAGMLGKIYCTWIREAGGIALDIGSAADFWCGHHTRSIPDVATYRTPKGVADAVRRFAERDPRYARLIGNTSLWQAS